MSQTETHLHNLVFRGACSGLMPHHTNEQGIRAHSRQPRHTQRQREHGPVFVQGHHWPCRVEDVGLSRLHIALQQHRQQCGPEHRVANR
jgi:hypothetical protein